MFAKVFKDGRSSQRPKGGDSMSVDGSNCDLFESLMNDVSEEDKQRHREGQATAMERFGYPPEAVDAMRNPKMPPVQSIAG